LEHLWVLKGNSSLAWLAAWLHKVLLLLCDWGSRDRKHNYIQKQWPKREPFIPGQKNIVNTALINPEKVCLAPLYIKLGLIKNFVKAMDQNSAGFMYLKNNFPRISDAKIKEGLYKFINETNYYTILFI
jgi:hypothetical protein